MVFARKPSSATSSPSAPADIKHSTDEPHVGDVTRRSGHTPGARFVMAAIPTAERAER